MPNHEPPHGTATGRIPALDGTRAIAVALVVMAHATRTSNFPASAPWLTSGALGVHVFFVLSGFLITTLLCREADRHGSVSLIAFYRRRALRILPALAVFLPFVAALQIGGLVTIPAGEWVAACLFAENFVRQPTWEIGHLWSLAIEERFYFAWPLLFAVLSRRGNRP